MSTSKLLILMHEVSHRYFGHEWADGLEYFLWREINGIALPRNSPLLKPHEIVQLEHASREEDAWYMYDEYGNFVRVTLDEWQENYDSEFGVSP